MQMERFSFLGLNPNESACLILYSISVLWVIYYSQSKLYLKLVIVVVEISLVVCVSATNSRGAAFTLICTGLYINFLLKVNTPSGEKFLGKIVNWILFNPTWKIVLLLCAPGMWARLAPAYVTQDASIFNRIELWKGAVKLISSAPVRGWGYQNTGTAYMNWFQRVDADIYYNGLVNSYLQIGAAWGLLALFGLLVVMSLGLESAVTLARQCDLSGILCLLIMLVWATSSCFSSMLASPLLIFPPFAAALWTILVNLKNCRCRLITQAAKTAFDPQPLPWVPLPRLHWFRGTILRKQLFRSVTTSFCICLLLFISGHALARCDSLLINQGKNCIISIENRRPTTGKLCAIYVDEEAIGRHYGKELRKFVLNTGVSKCLVISREDQLSSTESLIRQADVIILTGITVSYVKFAKQSSNYILLRPELIPNGVQCENIQTIVLPEIDRNHPLRRINFSRICLTKVQLVPFNEAFETTWSKYVNYR